MITRCPESANTRDALFVSATGHRPRHRVRNYLMLELQTFGLDVASLFASSHAPLKM